MKYVDEKFKDASPVETIDRVCGILASKGLTSQEHISVSGVKNCYSLGVRIEGTHMSTNGKGVTEDLARASGYGEMMERLQGGWLTAGKFTYNDAQFFNRKQLLNECGQWLSDIAESATLREKKRITVDMLIDACFAAEGNGQTVEVLPYYDVVGDRMTWFPRAINELLYITNGLAAGNSPEEAMVQGFSEIFERRYRFPFFLGNLVPPTVPEEYLQKFPNSYEIIRNLRYHGMDVIIKDCSCGEKFPLIASVVIDKANGHYRIHMGASPVFEIALERSLTEMFQGISLDFALTEDSFYIGKKGYRGAKEILGLLVRGLGAYPLDFFADDPSYPFEPFPEQENLSNAELLAWIVEFVKGKGKTLLVRDLSHLGFCDFQIIVPGMSEVVYSELAEPLPLYAMEYISKRVGWNLAEASNEELHALQILWRYKLETYKKRFDGSNKLVLSAFLNNSELGLPKEENTAYGKLYMAYIEWECGNFNVLQYAQAASRVLKGDDRTYLCCLCQVQPLAGTDALPDVLRKLKMFYPSNIVDEVADVIRHQKNPFRRFLICCTLDRCENCKFAGTCTKRKQHEIFEMLNAAVATFDEKAAFERIRKLFHAICVSEVKT